MTTGIRGAILALLACTYAASLGAQNSPAPEGGIRIILLGTAGGPPVRVGAAGISTLVEAGGDRLLFDADRARPHLAVRAFLVDHGPVKPAYGYRVDYRGHSVCLSGDTRPSRNLVEACRGVDILIHEAVDEAELRRLGPDRKLYEAIIGHHTTPEQAAEVFRLVGPRLAVFSHDPPGPAVAERTRRIYHGPVEQGEDLMVIDVGEQVVVRRPQSPAAR